MTRLYSIPSAQSVGYSWSAFQVSRLRRWTRFTIDRLETPVGATPAARSLWRSPMNGIHLMVIGVAAAAFLGLHPEAGSLFFFVASAGPTSSPGFAGYAGLPSVGLLFTGRGRDWRAALLLPRHP